MPPWYWHNYTAQCCKVKNLHSVYISPGKNWIYSDDGQGAFPKTVNVVTLKVSIACRGFIDQILVTNSLKQ